MQSTKRNYSVNQSYIIQITETKNKIIHSEFLHTNPQYQQKVRATNDQFLENCYKTYDKQGDNLV